MWLRSFKLSDTFLGSIISESHYYRMHRTTYFLAKALVTLDILTNNIVVLQEKDNFELLACMSTKLSSLKSVTYLARTLRYVLLRAYLGQFKYVAQNYLFIAILCVKISSFTRSKSS